MMKRLDRITELLRDTEADWKDIEAAINQNRLSETELMELAINATETFEFSFGNVKTDYNAALIENARTHRLTRTIELLLSKGLNTNTIVDGEPSNIMWELEFVDIPFLAATILRLLMEKGANPYIKNPDGELFFNEIDKDVLFFLNEAGEEIAPPLVQCWFVLIGYGGRPEGAEPFVLRPGHTYDELKEFEFFDWEVNYDSERETNVMHIMDIRTGEEIGVL